MIDDRIEGAYPTLVMEDMTTKILKEIEKNRETLICEQLMTLDIDKDVLIKQTQEIQRLNAELDKYRWIPVEEMLPKEGDVVLAYSIYAPVCTSRYFRNSVWWSYVTHWMPLPQPPLEEQEEQEG